MSGAELDEEQEKNHDGEPLVNPRQSSEECKDNQYQENHWQNVAEGDVGTPSSWIRKHSHAGDEYLNENTGCKEYGRSEIAECSPSNA